MSYLVLARKFRPLSFDTVSGQEHVTRTLANAIKRSKIAHAYLFTGPRGVGKTSIARIFAKALNCKDGPTISPCLKCTNCEEIAKGSSLSVREIDGASHNSVDNVRDLIDSFRSAPPPGSKYKIYIIDEVHMFSISAFNALLKSLEEPPPNTIFILATTEAHKIPETVISRCQRHDFKALPVEMIEQCLVNIAHAEKVEVETPAFRLIARLADGSVRDAQSLFERVLAFCDQKVTVAEVVQVLGVVSQQLLSELSRAVLAHDSAKSLELLSGAFALGIDPGIFIKEFSAHWRDLLIAKFGDAAALKDLGLSEDMAVELKRVVQSASTHDIQDLAELARNGADTAIRSSYPKYVLEALLVRMSTREEVKDIGAIIAELGNGRAVQAPPTRSASATTLKPTTSRQEAAPQVVESENERSSNLDWGKFVNFSIESGARMLAEQLKRLSVSSFTQGRLTARGPEVSIKYLKDRANTEKLQTLLEKYSNNAKWTIELSNGESAGRPEPGSLLANQEQEAKSKEDDFRKNLENHPKIKSLQKAFPGSKIEGVR